MGYRPTGEQRKSPPSLADPCRLTHVRFATSIRSTMQMMKMKTHWTGGQFRIFRVVFGFYLLQHFLALLPWRPEIFSSAGVLRGGNLSRLFRLFPNIFLMSSSALGVERCLVAVSD